MYTSLTHCFSTHMKTVCEEWQTRIYSGSAGDRKLVKTLPPGTHQYTLSLKSYNEEVHMHPHEYTVHTYTTHTHK